MRERGEQGWGTLYLPACNRAETEEAEGFGFSGQPDMAEFPTRGQAQVLRTGKVGGEWGVRGEADAGEGVMWGLRVCFPPEKAITGKLVTASESPLASQPGEEHHSQGGWPVSMREIMCHLGGISGCHLLPWVPLS